MRRWTRKNWITASGWTVGLALVALIVYPSIVRMYETLILMQTSNDLKFIVNALHQYHDDFGTFPPVALRDQRGNAIHSWRVILQESDDHDAGFLHYNFDEPWNSEANRRSLNNHRFGSHWYQFLAVVGPHAAWCEDRPRSMSEFTDGNANTILFIAMRNTGTEWYQPIDAVVAEDGTLTLNGKPLDTSVDMYVVTADGSIHRRVDIDPAVLKPLLTIDAGDTVPEW